MKSAREKRGARAGMALLYAVFSAVVAAGMVAMLLSMSMASTRIATVKNFGGRAEYLAQGAVEAAKGVVRSSIAGWGMPPASGSVTIDGHVVGYTIAQISPDGTVSNIKPWDPADAPVIRTDPSGVQTIVTSWRIDASATVQEHTATAHRLVHAEATPVFQYAVFYDSDLEINPGPSMSLRGRIHTNSDLYLGCTHTLTLDTNYVRSAGDIHRQRKDAPGISGGTVDIRNWVANPFDPLEPSAFFTMSSKSQMLPVPTAGGYDSDFTTGWDGNGDGDFTDPGDWLPWGPGAMSYWAQPSSYTLGTGSTVMDSSHGVTAAAPPPLDSIRMFEPATGGAGDWTPAGGDWLFTPGAGTHDKGFYHSHADLSIVANAAHTSWTAYDAAGNDVTSFVPAGAVTLSRIYDARQAGGASGTSTRVKTLSIDMGLLDTSSRWPANGLLYVGCNGKGTGTSAKGVELTKGHSLSTKLTVVSDGPLYLKGDYNTANKKGCAVIGDAVNLLSNAWDGTKSKGGAVPAAAPTVFNTAIVTGNTGTIPGSVYSGGFENLPRFHEDWSNIECTIHGSFVNFWPSQYATAPWGQSGVYTAPRRFWGYDPMFNSVANLPPFTPMTVVAVDLVCW